jgi:hypothetical protein
VHPVAEVVRRDDLGHGGESSSGRSAGGQGYSRPIKHSWLILASALVAFVAGLAVALVFNPRTVTHTVSSATATGPGRVGVPAACLQGIALTRKIEHAADRRQLDQYDIQFETAVAQCRVPGGCITALTFAPKIIAEHSRAKLLVLRRQFETAAATCR